jgi:hypothetical protein
MKLSEAQIQSLLDQHLRQSLNDDEERRVSADRIERDDLVDELETISFIKSDLKEELALNDYEGVFRNGPSLPGNENKARDVQRGGGWIGNAVQ